MIFESISGITETGAVDPCLNSASLTMSDQPGNPAGAYRSARVSLDDRLAGARIRGKQRCEGS